MGTFQEQPLPISVATVADLSTSRARTANGAVVATTGRVTPGDNGAASYIYRRTGRSGVTTGRGAFLNGPGVDDYWEVTRKDVLNFGIYGVDNTGATDVSSDLQSADSVLGETLVIPEGTYLISSDITFTRRVQFEFGAKFKIDNAVTVTFSNGYVAEDTQHVFDISLGGEVVPDNMSRVSAAHWGAVPDFVYPSTGTNSSPAIQACFDAANAIAEDKTWREPKRPEAFIPAGSYRLNTGVILRNRANLYAAGATLVYFGSQASDGAILTIGEFTVTGEEIELGTFVCPSVTGLMTRTQILQSEEEFAGIRIDACGSSVFYMELTNFVAIGLQLRPNTLTYVAHNHFLNHKSWATKWSIDFLWRWDQDIPGGNGWSNENVFTNCNYTQDSSSTYFGTTAGCRMRCTNSHPTLGFDVGGCNNNRFFGQCYQPGPTFAGTSLTVGLSVVAGNRYFNPTTRQEYICDVGGTVATVPTNTDLGQSSADANGVRFTHRGPYFHAGVYLDKNGGFNIWHGTRWEGGDGAFCYIANSASSAVNTSRHNEIVLYDYARTNPYKGGKVLIDDFTLARRNDYVGMHNTARIYGQELTHRQVINDIHKRVVISDTGICVRGMQWFNYGTNTVADYANYGFEHWRLLKESFYEVTSHLLGVVVDVTQSPRIGAMKMSYAPTPPVTLFGSPSIPGATSAVPLDNENNMIAVSTNTATDFVSNGLKTGNIWSIGGEPLYCSAGTNANVKRVFIGTGGGNGSISTHLELYSVPGGSINNAIVSVVSPDAGRFSTGTPIGGYFLERNEFIRHYTTEAFASSGWRVRTPGILAREWETGVDVEETELRMYGGNVYAALSSGTTGATAPTGTSSSVSDDLIDWEYIGPQAVLEEVYEGAALGVSSPPLVGNLTLRSDGSSSNWFKANTYISQKTLSGDFDVTFKLVDTGQSNLFGVTTDTAATDFNNYLNFDFGIYWVNGTTARIYQRAANSDHTVTWGNYFVRLVRTGTTLDLYINDALVALESASITADASTDVITSAGHGMTNGRPIRFEGADLPAGIVQGTVYYVINATTDTFKISATVGGAAVDITDAGSGGMTFHANAIKSSDMHVMYSAYDEPNSRVTILDEEYKPTAQGGALIAEVTDFDDVAEEAVVFSATAVFSFSPGRSKHKTMTLTNNATGLVVIAPEAGTYYIALTQDGTGGRTVAWATTIIGTAPTMVATADESTLFTIYSNGTDLFWM